MRRGRRRSGGRGRFGGEDDGLCENAPPRRMMNKRRRRRK